MNYHKKYLKYKLKYNNLKLNNLKKNQQLGGTVFADTSIVKIKTGDFQDQYGTVEKSWQCCTADNLLQVCGPNTQEKTFTVYSIDIPISEEKSTLINLKDTDVEQAVMFKIKPTGFYLNKKTGMTVQNSPIIYISIIRKKNNAETSIICEYLENKPYFVNDENKSMLVAWLKFGKNKGYQFESDIKLATKFNYVGQDVIIDINHTVSNENKDKWKIHKGHHGKIKDIVSNPELKNHYDITFEYIGPKQSNNGLPLVNSCKVTIRTDEHLLAQYTKPRFWFDNKILTCLPKTDENK